MFTRLRNTAHILAYREDKAPRHLTPEIEFVDHPSAKHSRIANFLGTAVGLFIVLFTVGISITWITTMLTELLRKPFVSVAAVGVIGGLIAIVLEKVSKTVKAYLARHFRIILTPHLGHKIEQTYRMLRG